MGRLEPARAEGVCIGGYLLQGGYGWKSRVFGPACESVIGLDMVTTDGEQIYCDADNYSDLYWAARGGGPGFFAVVTAFHLKIYPKPAVCGSSMYAYPFECVDEIFTWAHSISAELDRRVELQIVASRSVPAAGLDSPAIVFASPSFADSEAEAEDRQHVDVGVSRRAAAGNPSHHRDDAAAPVAFPLAQLGTVSGPAGHGLQPRGRDLPGVLRRLDGRRRRRQVRRLGAVEHGGDGGSGQRPARFATDEAMARLDEIRATYDPDGRFYSWMGRF